MQGDMNDIRSTFLCEAAHGRPATTNVHFVLDDNFSVAYGPELPLCTGAEEEMPLLRVSVGVYSAVVSNTPAGTLQISARFTFFISSVKT